MISASPVERIREALAGFGGVKRRFTKTGDWNGALIFDDYGHHPVEIAAVLQGGARLDQGQGDRDRAAASLHPARQPVRRFRRLLQRRRHGDRRRHLCGRRGADRGRRPRFAGLGHQGARPSPCAAAGSADQPCRHGRGTGRAGRLRRVPGGRQHHAMGLCAAGGAGGAGLAGLPSSDRLAGPPSPPGEKG